MLRSGTSGSYGSSVFSFLRALHTILRSLCVLSHFSRFQLFVTLCTMARQAPLSVGFSRQEYWSGFSFPSPGHLPSCGIAPCLLHLQHWHAGSLPVAPPEKPVVLQGPLPIYIPADSVGGFPFFHTLSHICCSWIF